MIDLMPTSEEEVAAIVRAHAESGRPLAICGGDSRSGFGNDMITEERLRSTGLSGIVAYNPGEMVMTARAGTPLAEVEAALQESGQMLAFEPMDHRPVMGTSGEPTIGGVFAANVSGPRRLIAGAARDSLLGVRFVNGKGEIIKAGGRVMKNVTGLDLVKLIAGSHGTLGFLTEVTFRVPPSAKTERTVVLSGLNDAEAANAMAAAMALPVEISSAAHLPLTVTWKFLAGTLPEGEATVLRIEGLAGSVDVRVEKLAAAMSAFATVTRLEQPESRRLWQEIRDVLPYADGTARPVWRVSVAPGTGHRLVAALRLEAGVDAFYDWQGGLVWMRMEAGPEAELVRRFIKALGGGHATLIRASVAARAVTAAFHPEPEAVAMLSRRVKEKFDPAGIFNPGKMG
ncbi:glycolate oxidase FAD binding subunit [Rhizobium leguminosarum]|uniref:Glycolate oxidase FAD binding subunit n=1 Tax=Rhizobium leguminosarum TaxID=384 RepID=A0AAE2SVC6_RHILE|nr:MULTISPECIES: glycolate oxidase subunit GlcE [Rhizobium]MBB4288598.1 glycolate oxidase FAD binding subunit [Rhizobium leguminosarum]MBB4295309.1 glycolate oxidase FAD binding subunit [Rhizobium leguminosarum]MBB4306702.1 glycolate oxidase FAD binding subunit [Rhizobium leguminosarum]MBB4417716.1 glycolate oxidase FAD binding subunit [Rhizobium leguminosarum]MBB4432562.1 glycolate oxidase FAD binding subunit [Rhizobium esperanzae]